MGSVYRGDDGGELVNARLLGLTEKEYELYQQLTLIVETYKPGWLRTRLRGKGWWLDILEHPNFRIGGRVLWLLSCGSVFCRMGPVPRPIPQTGHHL